MLRRDAIKDVRRTTFEQSKFVITRVPAVTNKTIYHEERMGTFINPEITGGVDLIHARVHD